MREFYKRSLLNGREAAGDAAFLAGMLFAVAAGAFFFMWFSPRYAGESHLLMVPTLIFLGLTLHCFRVQMKVNEQTLGSDEQVQSAVSRVLVWATSARRTLWMLWLFGTILVGLGISARWGSSLERTIQTLLMVLATGAPAFLLGIFSVSGIERTAVGKKSSWFHLCHFIVQQGSVVFVTRFGVFVRVAHPGLNWRTPWFENSDLAVSTKVEHMAVVVNSVTSDGVPVTLEGNIEAVVKSPESFCKTYFHEQNVLAVLLRICREHLKNELRKYCAAEIRGNDVLIAKQVQESLANCNDLTSRTGYSVEGVEALRVTLNPSYAKALDDKQAIPLFVEVERAKQRVTVETAIELERGMQGVRIEALRGKVEAVVNALPGSLLDAVGRRIGGTNGVTPSAQVSELESAETPPKPKWD